jgi:hypothetical protein
MKPAQICPSCGNALQIERLRCQGCATLVEGKFGWPRLARLSPEDQQLVELMILSSGSLKDVAKKLGISYPTVRKRLDELIGSLEVQVKKDEQLRRQLLKDVAAGKRSAEDVARQIQSS